ncbi:hypothetical protein SO802_012395 [Lithocarpus litseifolius]|uniref:LysM domain-containing protein n=1 Tax=Lithocarpus litseifolius TaxID=425828 RepID=A0AAW2D412_9ROSI
MQMEKERWNGNNNMLEYEKKLGVDVDVAVVDQRGESPSPVVAGCIQHPVSKMDTLAGIAIKYGVEVSDIKKMNGLVTDLQMFALKSLQIPLPGRHPPSPCLSNGHGQSSSNNTPPRRVCRELFESFQTLKVKSPQWKVSPAMSSLQGYYGLKTIDQKSIAEGFEMAVYRKGGSHYLEDGPFPSASLISNPSLSHHRKSKSLVTALLDENGVIAGIVPVAEARDGDSDRWSEKLVRRRQKSEADFTSRTPEMLLENNSNGGGFSAITGKGLALRPKAANRATSISDAEANGLIPIPIGLGDSMITDGLSGVRKSSSTSSLQEQDNNSSSSIWSSTRWSLKPDLQSLSTATITKPIFDGLPKPKPIIGRRNKAALD